MEHHIKKFAFLVGMIFVSLSTLNADIAEAKSLSQKYVDYQTNHFVDRLWRANNFNSMMHPDFFGLGRGKIVYTFANSNLPRLDNDNLFIDVKIKSVKESMEYIDISLPKGTLTPVYYAELEYLIVATSVHDKLTFIKDPFTYVQYLIMYGDKNDGGKLKVIDVFPSVKPNLIGAQYLIDNFNQYDDNKKLLSDLKNQITKLYGPGGLKSILTTK